MNTIMGMWVAVVFGVVVSTHSWAAPGPTNKGITQEKQAPLEPLSDPQEVFFTVLDYEVDGNTILPQAKIDEVLQDYTGFAQQVSDIERARKALEKTYHEEGYPTVIVVLPQQQIDSGHVQLSVVESQIEKVTMTGNTFFSEETLMEKMPSVKPGWVIHQPTLLEELADVNFHPDRQVTPVLKPGEETGKVNLELKVNDRLPLHGKVKADNKGALATPSNRLSLELQYTNLFDLEHILTLQTVHTPEEWGEVQVYGFTYVAPLGSRDRLFSVFASVSESASTLAAVQLGSQTGDVGIAGNSKSAGIRYNFPLAKTENLGTHSLSLGADFTRLEESTAEAPTGGAIVSSPVQYTPLSATYNGIIPHHEGITILSTTAKGYVAGLIPGGDKEDFAGNPKDTANKPGNRVGSTGTFAILRASLDRSQTLPEGFSVNAHVDGQWANEPLLAAEQLFGGGMDTVRGYQQNETLGDNGIRTRLEILTPFTTLPYFDRPVASNIRTDLQFAVFYDTAFLWIIRNQPGQLQRFNLEGAGLGIRLNLSEYVKLQLDNACAKRNAGTTSRGDFFAHFSLGLAV